MVLQTSMFPWQQKNAAVMEETFPTQSVPRYYNQGKLVKRTAGVQLLFAVALRSW
jgi:hypothetical protein